MFAHFILIIILTVMVSSSVIYGVIEGGSPFELRDKRFDQAKLKNIHLISSSIESYYAANNKLPQKIEDLFKDQRDILGGTRDDYKDPETNKEFEYSAKDDYSYQICADFSSDSTVNPDYATNGYRRNLNEYKKGRHCFDLIVAGHENYMSSPTPTPAATPINTKTISGQPLLVPSPTATPPPTNENNSQDGITNIYKDGVPYFVIIGSYKGTKNQYEITISTVDKFGKLIEASVLHDQNRDANIIDKQNKPLQLDKFVSGDKVRVEANTARGESYDANTIQNLVR